MTTCCGRLAARALIVGNSVCVGFFVLYCMNVCLYLFEYLIT